MNIFQKIYTRLLQVVDKFKYTKELKELYRSVERSNNCKRIILFQTPAHTNIGDHAIAEAEIQFLGKYCPEYTVVEVNQAYHMSFLNKMKDRLKATDIIMLHGGGNFGNQYMHEEYIRRSAINAFPKNKIIVFPQTIYYTDDQEGQRELGVTKRIINTHGRVVLMAREQVSFHMMNDYFPTSQVILTPDIVLSMDQQMADPNREGILMVLRDDEEKTLTDDQHETLDLLAHRYAHIVTYSDMHYHEWVRTIRGRKDMLNYKFGQFRGAKLVITDRLHGMVFAAVTKTPCIAFSNYNQKVSGTYNWIEDLNYIRFVDFSTDIGQHMEELMSLSDFTAWNPSLFEQYYQQIIDIIYE